MGARTITTVLALTAAIAVLGLAACSSPGGGPAATQGAGTPAAADLGPLPDVTGPSSAVAAKPTGPTGPAIQVTWEALAREKYLLENSRFRRPGQPMPPQKIMLFSESHPEAARVKRPRSREERAKYSGSAVLSDQDMQRLLQGLRQQGFFRYARPGGYDSSVVASDNARGRIIVEQDGTSHMLVSMRGQGQDPNTRAIPKLYSETKQAIMVLRNSTPTLNVSQVGVTGTAR